MESVSSPKISQNPTANTFARKTRPSLTPRASSAVSSPPKQRPSTPIYHDRASLINTKTLGTSATSSPAIVLLGDLLVYTAGTGAVLAQLTERSTTETGDRVDTSYAVYKQRFLCTSPKIIGTSVAIESITQAGSPCAQSRDSNGHILTTKTISSISNSMFSSNDDKLSVSSKDRVKSTKCVAISSDGKLIAVGEVGYQPRILIYSTASDSTGQALAVMTEHSFGVEILSFSPCGKYLASLGTPNDGFVHIWNLCNLKDGIVSLHASNKCTSFISDMKWMGNRIITAGLRHLRLWSIEGKMESSKQCGVLSGRNIVLGELAQSRLVAIVPLSENVCIISSDKGDICTLQDQLDDKSPLFTSRIKVEIDVTSLDVNLDTYGLWVGGPKKSIMHIPLQKLLVSEYEPKVGSPSKILPNRKRNEIVSILNFRSNTAIVLNSDRDISIVKVADIDRNKFTELCTIDSSISLIPGHTGPITGIGHVCEQAKDRANSLSITGEFFTWSKDGIIRFWNQYGDHISEIQFVIPQDNSLDIDNELVSVSSLNSAPRQLAVGDKLGNLTVIDTMTMDICFFFNAHRTDITSIATAVGHRKEWIVTSSRDRTVQIFAKELDRPGSAWGLHQTLESHRGTVVKVILSANAEFIYTCSTDRTIGVHKVASLPRKTNDEITQSQNNNNEQEVMFYVSERLITLKSAPADMIFDEEEKSLIVSTVDKQIIVFKHSGGEPLKAFRTCENGELFNLSYIGLLSHNKSANSERKYLVGLGSDKSIRVYDYGSHGLITTNWAHSEGVTGLICLQQDQTIDVVKNLDSTESDGSIKFKIVSTGQDGCASIWSFILTNSAPSPQKSNAFSSQSTSPHFYPPPKMPSRKILSKNEVAALLQKPLKTAPNYSLNAHSRLSEVKTPETLYSDFSDDPVLKMKSLSLKSPSSTPPGDNNTTTKKLLGPLQRQLQLPPKAGDNPSPRLQRSPSKALIRPINTSTQVPSMKVNSKSTSTQLEERKMIDNRTDSLASPIRKKTSMSGMASSVAETSKPYLNSETRSIELLCKDLQQFREQFSNSIYIEKGRINQLKDELIKTITLVDNSYETGKALEDMDVLLRTFGDKLCKIFEARINLENPDS